MSDLESAEDGVQKLQRETMMRLPWKAHLFSNGVGFAAARASVEALVRGDGSATAVHLPKRGMLRLGYFLQCHA